MNRLGKVAVARCFPVVGLLLVAQMLGGGCATQGVYNMAPADAPHGYAEFYVVPSYAKDAGTMGFEVSVSSDINGKTQRLGNAMGGPADGKRFRVLCSPGRHEFQLDARCMAKDSTRPAPLSTVIDVKEGMVAPVRVSVRVNESGTLGKSILTDVLVGGALGNALKKGANYEARVDTLPAQPFYVLATTSHGWNGVAFMIEAHNEQQLLAMRQRMDVARQGLDIRREEDWATFLSRYEKVQPKTQTGQILRIGAIPNFSLTFRTAAFEE